MKSFAHYASALLLVTTLAGPAAGAGTAPDALVKSTTEQVLAVVKESGDAQRIVARAQPLVAPHFDFARMTQLAVGRAWATTSAAQKQALEKQFRDLLIRTYALALAKGARQDVNLTVSPLAAPPAGDEVTVHTQVRGEDGKPIVIDYQMEKAGDGWKVFDVTVAGISLVTNYRSTFAAEIEKSGVDGLINTLAEKNKSLATGKAG